MKLSKKDSQRLEGYIAISGYVSILFNNNRHELLFVKVCCYLSWRLSLVLIYKAFDDNRLFVWILMLMKSTSHGLTDLEWRRNLYDENLRTLHLQIDFMMLDPKDNPAVSKSMKEKWKRKDKKANEDDVVNKESKAMNVSSVNAFWILVTGRSLSIEVTS